MTKLSRWINNAVQEHRIRELTKIVVSQFLRAKHNHTQITTAHIMARWPTLKVLAPDLKPRFDNAPDRLGKWGWNAGNKWLKKYKSAMQLADMAITGADMIPSKIEDNSPVKAELLLWRKLSTDAV